jgi:hypothetical protein
MESTQEKTAGSADAGLEISLLLRPPMPAI